MANHMLKTNSINMNQRKITWSVAVVVAITTIAFACKKSNDSTDSTTTTTTTDTTTTVSTECSSATGVDKVVCLANAFLATLSSTQKTTVVLTLNLTNAKRWSNLPCGVSCRNGLAFSSLSATQLAAAKAVIKDAAGTSTGEGYVEFITINTADDYLSIMSKGY